MLIVINILINIYFAISLIRTGYAYYEWKEKNGGGWNTFLNALFYGFFGLFMELYYSLDSHIEVKQYEDPESRLIICIKKNITLDDGSVVELDNGHFGLIAAHSTGIAFNSWSEKYNNPNIWYPNYPNLKFTDKYTSKDFYNWRTYSFRKLLLQIDNDKEFESIKQKLIRDKIPFRICGEIAFGEAEVGIVIFPLKKENTPKYLKFLKMFK